MTVSIVTVLIAVAVVAIPVALLAFVVVGRRPTRTAQDRARHAHYDNYAFVYDHPRSTR